jgi:hypothetical protein
MSGRTAPGLGGRGHSPLVGGSLARCLLRGSAPARAAAATRSAPHPPAGGPAVTHLRSAPAKASRAVLRRRASCHGEGQRPWGVTG